MLNSSSTINSSRIMTPSDYSRYEPDFKFHNNSLEFVTFYRSLIKVSSFETVFMTSNKFKDFGFFSESLMRSIFPMMQTPVSS